MIGVMGPAKAGIRELADAKTLGELIARQGWVVLTGGRASGVMDFDAAVTACPACGQTFETTAKRCPSCGLRFG